MFISSFMFKKRIFCFFSRSIDCGGSFVINVKIRKRSKNTKNKIITFLMQKEKKHLRADRKAVSKHFVVRMQFDCIVNARDWMRGIFKKIRIFGNYWSCAIQLIILSFRKKRRGILISTWFCMWSRSCVGSYIFFISQSTDVPHFHFIVVGDCKFRKKCTEKPFHNCNCIVAWRAHRTTARCICVLRIPFHITQSTSAVLV